MTSPSRLLWNMWEFRHPWKVVLAAGATLFLVGLLTAGVLVFTGSSEDGVTGPAAQGPVGASAPTVPSAPGDVTVNGEPRDEPLAPGDAVPSFEAPALAGGTVSWETYAGSPAVLSIWASWCSHCQAELPVVDRLMHEYPDVGWFTIVTAIDVQPGPAPEEYMLDANLSFPVAVDDSENTLASAFGIQALPTTYFINSDGTVARELEGEVDEATLRSTIEALT